MTAPAAGQGAVLAAYQQQTTAARAQLLALITGLWRSLPDYRNKSMADFAIQAVPLVQAAMGHMQALTSAYMASLNGAAGLSATPVAVPVLGIAAVRNGADPFDVYGRPFHVVWRQLHDGALLQDVIASGQTRAANLAATDLQLAKTRTAQAGMSRNRNVVGYRRQLEGAHSCALCIVASTRMYHKADLMPIHPGCDCQVVPMYGGEKIGAVLDPTLLAAAHATVAEQFGADSTAARRIRGAFKDDGSPVLYRDVLITHEHGELGPILGIRGQSFLGPSDIAA